MEESISKILELGISQGIWAALYIYLFFRMLKENKEREDRYQETIDRLSGNIEGGIEKIQNKLDSMSNRQLIPASPAGLLTRLTHPIHSPDLLTRLSSLIISCGRNPQTTPGHSPNNNQEKEKNYGKQSF
ncbi:MAG: BhlA/UviB family holin-like peptide [Christensenellales bacterium]